MKPWEKYQQSPQKSEQKSAQKSGPWQKFQAKPAAEQKKPEPGLVWSDITTDAELEQIASKHSIPSDVLKETAAYFGATKSDETPLDLLKQAAGFVGQASAVGLPQKIYKMSQKPEVEAALDELSKLAQQKKSYLREAAEIFGGFGTGAVAAKLGRAALPVFGAAAGLGASEAGGELPGAAIGAVAAPVVGAAIGKVAQVAAPLLRKAASKLPKPAVKSDLEDLAASKLDTKLLQAEQKVLETGKADDLVEFLGESRVNNLLNPTSSEYRLVVAQLKDSGIPVSNRNIAAEIAKSKLESTRGEIARRVGADSWEQAVKEQGGTRRLVQEILPQIRQEQAAIQAAQEANIGKNIRRVGTLEGMLLKLSDDKPVMKIIDKRLGGAGKFSAEQAVDDISEGIARYSPEIKAGVDRLVNFEKVLKSNNLTREQFNESYRLGRAPASVKAEWDKLTSELLTRANQAGAGIEARANYIRDQLLAPAELQAALKTRADQLSKQLDLDVLDMTPDQFRQVSKLPQMQDMFKAVELIAGKPSTSNNQFTNNLRNIFDDVAAESGRLYSQLGAAKAKLGDIPDFIREVDPIHGMETWLASTYKNLATREPVERLRSLANVADEAGDAWTAKHLRDKISDILGTRRDTIAAGGSQLANKWTAYWTSKNQPVLADMPDYLRQLNRQIYPNLLGGLNIKVSLQNLATPAMSAIPDVGYKAGTAAWWNSLGATREYLLKNGRAGLEQLLAREGMIPANIGRELGAELGTKAGKLGKVNQMSADALMFGFNLSELLGRSQAYFMGQELGKKVAANPEWGSKFINKINSPAYRKSLGQALSRGDVASLQKQLSKYLNSNHLLNYDKANQSAFGRFVGPTFSAFQKWPSTMLGRVLQEYYDKGAASGTLEVTKKMLAPVAALGILDEVVRGDDKSERSKKILGRSLTQMAPGSALKDVGTFSPPAVGIAGEVKSAFESIADGDEGKLKRAAKKALMTYAPGAGWLKMFGEDLPILVTGEKPRK